MSLIYIKEIYSDAQSVGIQVDGFLDVQSLPVLKEFYGRYLKDNKRIHLHLGGLRHISREGKDFLKEIKGKVTYVDPPSFIRLTEEILLTDGSYKNEPQGGER